MGPESDVRAVLDRWAAAEVAGDADALEALAARDFVLCGPAGFVLDREQWAQRYRTGPLRTTSLELDDLSVRQHGTTVITVAVQTQTASYDEHDASGRFRTTHVLVADGDSWTLAAQHLSPLADGAS